MEPSKEHAVTPGQILAGKYRIEKILGEGGMGVVVSATHLQLQERVAIKFLLPQVLNMPDAVERFAREARAAVKIKSEHVVRVSDVGEFENGSPYMVMEHLEGVDLGGLVQAQGALPVPVAVAYVLQACEAIAEAHSLGIVHRDLKPANLFVASRPDGTPLVKVLDFGISKLTGLGAADLGMTKTASVMGSPLYMAPEQMVSTKDVDARADIWSLGVILHEILVGRVPFDAETLPQLCAMILQNDAPAIRTLRADVPEGLETAIQRALARDRNQRFSNVAEFAQSLLPFAPDEARRSVERVSRLIIGVNMDFSSASTVMKNPHPGAKTSAAWAGTNPPHSSRSRIALLAGAALLFVGGGAAAFFAAPRFAPEKVVATASPAHAALVSPAAASPAPAPVAKELKDVTEPKLKDALVQPVAEIALTETPAPVQAVASKKAPAVKVTARPARPAHSKPTPRTTPPASTPSSSSIFGDRK